MAIIAHELNLDDNQIVDMVQVIADTLLRVLQRVDPPDDQVTSRSSTKLADGMSRQGELPLAPLHRHLQWKLESPEMVHSPWSCCSAHPLVLDVEIILAHVVEKSPSIGGMQKGHGNTAVVGPQEDIK